MDVTECRHAEQHRQIRHLHTRVRQENKKLTLKIYRYERQQNYSEGTDEVYHDEFDQEKHHDLRLQEVREPRMGLKRPESDTKAEFRSFLFAVWM